MVALSPISPNGEYYIGDEDGIKHKNSEKYQGKSSLHPVKSKSNGSNNKHHLTPSGRREQRIKNNPERLGPIQVRSSSRQQNLYLLIKASCHKRIKLNIGRRTSKRQNSDETESHKLLSRNAGTAKERACIHVNIRTSC